MPVVRPLDEFDFDIAITEDTAFSYWGVIGETEIDGVLCKNVIMHLEKEYGANYVLAAVGVCSDRYVARYAGGNKVAVSMDVVECDADTAVFDACDNSLGAMLTSALAYRCDFDGNVTINDIIAAGAVLEYRFSI